VVVDGADDDPTTHGYNAIEVIDPLDPSLDPIIVRTSQNFESSDDDNDLISDILPAAEESIEEDAYSDTADQHDDLQSQPDTVPTQAASHVRPVLESVATDFSGKRPRDDPSA
jgi:hypothetical protein